MIVNWTLKNTMNLFKKILLLAKKFEIFFHKHFLFLFNGYNSIQLMDDYPKIRISMQVSLICNMVDTYRVLFYVYIFHTYYFLNNFF